jgi:succinate dehydrogenase / fumarate reductase, cytochrome b subunit
VERAPRSRTRRLHSVSGVVPIGAFLVLHLWTNAAATSGPDAYNAAARRLQQLPLLPLFEILLIGLPIFFHGIYGFFIAATESPAAGGRTAARRALAVFQRVTGVAAFVFILFHLWTSRLVQLHDHDALDLFRLMQAALANPWIRAGYAAGILAATAHFSAGLWTFCETWGFLPGRRARVAVAAAAAGLFGLLSGLGLRSLSAFRLPL